MCDVAEGFSYAEILIAFVLCCEWCSRRLQWSSVLTASIEVCCIRDLSCAPFCVVAGSNPPPSLLSCGKKVQVSDSSRLPLAGGLVAHARVVIVRYSVQTLDFSEEWGM